MIESIERPSKERRAMWKKSRPKPPELTYHAHGGNHVVAMSFNGQQHRAMLVINENRTPANDVADMLDALAKAVRGGGNV